ncbi:MAG: GspE/PulE family protein [Clostridiales bacterium]|nr:GspE/PulE family protein [Clostridiales bacterium]
MSNKDILTCDLYDLTFDMEIPKSTLGHFYCDKYAALPVRREGGRLWVATSDPQNGRALNSLADLTGMFIEPMFAREEDIRFHINRIFGSERIGTIASQFAAEELKRAAVPGIEAENGEDLRNAPAVRLIESLIESAVLYRASDIHLEPGERHMRARFRVDGRLTDFQRVDISMQPHIISRLKILGGMDIAEKRLPQDGHFKARVREEDIDFRLSTLPTLHGEKAAVRLLYGKESRLGKDELGFFPEDLTKLNDLFNRPFGAVFITGPTGSGKSTTLSCFMEGLNTGDINIVTVEDPVENPLPGVNHMRIEPAAGLTFQNALRSILRQDPDVIMIGEIRDPETARIAIQAAVTGHLVLATLHTNDAAGVLERLLDMGVEPYLVAAALSGVISQRLVRRICPDCKAPKPLSAGEALTLGVPPGSPSFAGAGCSRCGGTGYRGRLAVYEYIITDDALKRRMIQDPERFAVKLRKKRAETGLKANCLRNIAEGNTTAGEIIRALNYG